MKKIMIMLLVLSVIPCYAPEGLEERARQEEARREQTKAREIEEEQRQQKLREQEALEEELAQKEAMRYKQQEQKQKTSQSTAMTRAQLKQDALENYQEIYSHQQKLKREYLELQGKILQLEIMFIQDPHVTMKEAFENDIFARGNLVESLKVVNEQLAVMLKKTQQGPGKSPLLSSSDIKQIQTGYANSLAGREIAQAIPSLEQDIQKLNKDLAAQKATAKKKPEFGMYEMGYNFVAKLGIFLSKDATLKEIREAVQNMDNRTKFDLTRNIPDVLSLVDDQMRIAKKNIEQTSFMQSLLDQLFQIIKNLVRLVSHSPEEAVGPYLPQILKAGAKFMDITSDTTFGVEQNNIHRQEEYDGLAQQRRVISQLQKVLSTK